MRGNPSSPFFFVGGGGGGLAEVTSARIYSST